jgi:hypothetical protein
MGPLDLLNHLLNFVAPALWLALLLPLGARLLLKKRPAAATFWTETVVNFAANLLVLLVGLWFFGHDGKMVTYVGMVLVCATSQWLLRRC